MKEMITLSGSDVFRWNHRRFAEELRDKGYNVKPENIRVASRIVGREVAIFYVEFTENDEPMTPCTFDPRALTKGALPDIGICPECGEAIVPGSKHP